MNIQELKKELTKQIEVYKRNAIENIEKEAMIPAMWDISSLIDLKAQMGILNKIEESEK